MQLVKQYCHSEQYASDENEHTVYFCRKTPEYQLL